MKTPMYLKTKQFAKFARRDNIVMEKLVKLTPSFNKVKDQLITIIGQC